MARKKVQESTAATIELTRLSDSIVEVPILGLTPYIPHSWSEKSKRMMPGHPDRETVKQDKGARDPAAEAEACLYLLGGKLAAPAVAFKAAIIGACRFFEKPSMVEAKQLVSVLGEGVDQLVSITGRKELREDTPRNANGNADLRYRYYVYDWAAVLKISYVSARITADSVISLVDAAGRGGIGDWRPSAPKSYTGIYGTWRVDDGGKK